MALPEIADYRLQSVSEIQTAMALRTATACVHTVLEKAERVALHRLPSLQQPQMKRAIAELEQKLLTRWPAATFEAHRGEASEGVYLDVAVDADFWDVMDEIDELQ